MTEGKMFEMKTIYCVTVLYECNYYCINELN